LQPFIGNFIDALSPLHAFDAPKPGTGKTLLVNLASMIATGRNAEMLSETGDREEMRKRITALLLSGASMAVIEMSAGESTTRLWRRC